MPEVETQIRAYFDEVVERVTEDDIRIRATTERGVPIRRPRFQIRPVAAAAIGFGIAMTVLGGVFITNAWFVPEAADVAGNGVGRSPGIAERPSPVWLFPLMAGFGLLAFGMWSVRRSAGDVRQRGDEDMQTIERPETLHAPSGELTKLRKRNRLLAWAVALLAVAVIGLGTWLVAEILSSGTGSLPAAAEATVDDYTQAWETNDSELFLATTTEDYVFLSNGVESSRASQAALIGRTGHFAIEIDSTTATGDGPYYVGQAGRVQSMSGGPWWDGHWMLELVEVDGTWKVALQYWIGEL